MNGLVVTSDHLTGRLIRHFAMVQQPEPLAINEVRKECGSHGLEYSGDGAGCLCLNGSGIHRSHHGTEEGLASDTPLGAGSCKAGPSGGFRRVGGEEE